MKSSPYKRAASAVVLAAALLPVGPLAAGKADVPTTVFAAATRAVAPTTPPIAASPPARLVWELPGSEFHPGDPVVALTFDDGPNPRWTDPIMDILARYNAPATFFIVGRMANGQPDRVRAEAVRGYGVGNHTWDHVDLTNAADWTHEVEDTSTRLELLSGRPVDCARPPFGSINADVNAQLRERGMTAVLWDVDSQDYTKPGVDAIVKRVLGAMRPGAIVLMHDGGGDRSETVAALPRIIEGIQAAGLRPVSLCRPSPRMWPRKSGRFRP